MVHLSRAVLLIASLAVALAACGKQGTLEAPVATGDAAPAAKDQKGQPPRSFILDPLIR